MSDTIRTRSTLLTLYADNTSGGISAQDGRDFIVSVYDWVNKAAGGKIYYDENFVGIGDFSASDPLARLHVEDNLYLGMNGVASGKLTLIASDNDQATISISTADKLLFEGASGGYLFDAVIDGTDIANTTIGVGGASTGAFTTITASTSIASAGAVNVGVNDTTQGILRLYGANTILSGTMYIYTAGDDDTTVDYWQLAAYVGTTLTLGNNTGLHFYFYNGGNLTIAGATATKASGTTWAEASDKRIKENIANITDGLGIIRLLQPKSYQYTDEWITRNPALKKDIRYRGFVADDLVSILPNAITIRKDTLADKNINLKVLDVSDISVLTVSAIKELDTKVTELQNRIGVLEKG